MEYRTLGRTGLKVSVFGIGSWQLSGPLLVDGMADGFPDVGREKAIALIQSCGDLGINLIDTAPIYGNGEGEKRIGAAIRGKRDQWIISSKFGLGVDGNGNRIVNSQPNTIRPSLERSLERLQTEYIDIYLYHCPPAATSILAGKHVLEELKQEGKLRFYGISSENHGDIQPLLNRNAVEVVLTGQSLVQHPARILALVKNNHLGFMVRGSFAAGLLSGKYFHQSPHFSTQDFRQSLKMRWNQYQSYERLLPSNVSMPAFALRYLLDFSTTQTIILGSRSLQQYQNAINVLDLPPLSPKMHQTLSRVRQINAFRNLPRRILRRLGQSIPY